MDKKKKNYFWKHERSTY